MSSEVDYYDVQRMVEEGTRQVRREVEAARELTEMRYR